MIFRITNVIRGSKWFIQFDISGNNANIRLAISKAALKVIGLFKCSFLHGCNAF